MQSSDQPILRDIVLIGGGHSHAIVLKSFAMHPMAGVRLTLICTDSHTPYSGMLPGYIAGHCSFDDVHIDLGKLCAMAGVRFYKASVTGIDRAAKKVICQGRPAVDYDVLSINIGSSPQVNHVLGADLYATPVKPIAQFNERWLAFLARASQAHTALRVAVVGAGAGGVELLLAMQYRFQKINAKVSFSLFTKGAAILPTHSAAVQRRLLRLLQVRGAAVHVNAAVTRVSQHHLYVGERVFDFDEVIWVTGAGGAAWLADTGLALDERGFIQVNDCLQSTMDVHIFAAGDIASMPNDKLEKAGVFALRQGMPLAENLRRSVQGAALKPYRPQKRWLALISTGDQHAVASRGALWSALTALGIGGANASGALLWRWKDWIDRRFMRRFSELLAMNESAHKPQPIRLAAGEKIKLTSEESLQAISAIAMRCGGCGAKVGATVLSRALGSLAPIANPAVLIGLHAPDDAAVVRIPAGKAMVHTVDFFRALIDDPYTFGKIAANHALGDIFAMGAIAQSATAIATVPAGLETKVEATLRDMMTGAVEVLNAAGCTLVGGHTGEGKELALGFAINGLADIASDGITLPKTMTKGTMRAGDVLILTKPIGTGTLFAAHPLGQAKGRWIDAALVSMQQSNQAGATCLLAYEATACTDVTGFGLLGHLMEMTKASGVDAEINLSALPLLQGAEECVAAGMTSSLQNANVGLKRAIKNQEAFAHHPRYPLIFDPQTAGGLLASVPKESAKACVTELKKSGYLQATIIGCVLPMGDAAGAITLIDTDICII
ncbi:MAG: selenide, water dikinase SelD [Cytophagales bacterium]|nr:selenide, water dikinase SelD [Cytophagales bacterium]